MQNQVTEEDQPDSLSFVSHSFHLVLQSSVTRGKIIALSCVHWRDSKSFDGVEFFCEFPNPVSDADLRHTCCFCNGPLGHAAAAFSAGYVQDCCGKAHWRLANLHFGSGNVAHERHCLSSYLLVYLRLVCYLDDTLHWIYQWDFDVQFCE